MLNRTASFYGSLALIVAIFLIGLPGSSGSFQAIQDAHAASSISIPEGRDYSTVILKDPWDMGEYSDVSQYINGDGQFNLVKNINIQNSVFSAQSTIEKDAFFHVLSPGFHDTISGGKTGVRYPINSNQFHCLYVAMRVGAPPDGSGSDQFQIFWFADGRMNSGDAPWGSTPGFLVYPEAHGSTPIPYWKMFKIDLATQTSPTGWEWNDQPVWRGLRIDPTVKADVDFSVDWVRLTDCVASNYTFTWTPRTGTYDIWIRPENAARNIRVATDVDGNSGSTTIDAQGLAPGSYQVGLGSSTDCCTVWSPTDLVINQSPIALFSRPSFTSGRDYSSSAGNPWDFSDSSDVVAVYNSQATIQSGVLDLITQSGSYPKDLDAQVFLNVPQVFDGNQYRFLTFRYFTEGPWQRFGGGMVVRWIWTIPGMSDGGGSRCHLVSQDIPHDVGWQTISIDLFAQYNGSVEQTSGDCEGADLTWSGSSGIYKLRFDPNENIMGVPLHQQVDWIRLTQVDSVTKGNPFPVQIGLNKSPDGLTLIAFYYTDNLQNPTQHRAVEYKSFFSPESTLESRGLQSGLPLQEAQAQIFLPAVLRNPVASEIPPVENAVDFAWDTTGVNPGEYYMCVVVADQHNSATYCSEAPVKVIASN